jgi:hypothetical protein
MPAQQEEIGIRSRRRSAMRISWIYCGCVAWTANRRQNKETRKLNTNVDTLVFRFFLDCGVPGPRHCGGAKDRVVLSSLKYAALLWKIQVV